MLRELPATVKGNGCPTSDIPDTFVPKPEELAPKLPILSPNTVCNSTSAPSVSMMSSEVLFPMAVTADNADAETEEGCTVDVSASTSNSA